MVIAATGFAVLLGGWAGGLVQAETAGRTEIALRVGLGILFFGVIIGIWLEFRDVDEERAD